LFLTLLTISGNNINLAGAVTANGTIPNNYFAAWSGKTIKYISDHVGPSLAQRPNIVLLHAGTNDMNPNPWVSTEGNEPGAAAERLGGLIDQINTACPDAIVLVAMIINTCDPAQSPQTKQYQALIPGVVAARRTAGHQVLAVDFTSFPISELRDCIHPTNKGYDLFGDFWYDFITQIPKEWINSPFGSDPYRPKSIFPEH
jgi:lysophospholipase L1-like esterase